MTIRALIFDVGGVILRTEDASHRLEWEKRLNLPRGALAKLIFESREAERATVGELTLADVWHHAATELKLNETELGELQRDFWAGDRIDTGLVEYIRTLRPRYKTALLTNGLVGFRQLLRDRYGLADAVDLLVVSAEEGVAKPDARIFELAARRLGVAPGEAIFVDDVAANVAAAEAVGLVGVQFRNTDQVMADIAGILESQESHLR